MAHLSRFAACRVSRRPAFLARNAADTKSHRNSPFGPCLASGQGHAIQKRRRAAVEWSRDKLEVTAMTAHRSPWQLPKVPGGNSVVTLDSLERDLTVDVCVVGAGIAGLLCALELTERGRSVVVLEREGVAAGDTAATTAHLTTLLDTRYFALAQMHGAEAARLVATSHMRGIAHLERVVNAYGIECGFQRVSGFLCAANAEQAELLAREHAAATAAGISAELVRRPPLPLGDG